MSRGQQIHRWLVFLSACASHFLATGMFFSLGVFLNDLMVLYNIPRSKASLVQAIANACCSITAILYGELKKRYGILNVASVGAVMVAFGMSISYVANSIYFLIVSIGFVAATGTINIFILSSSAVGRSFSGKSTSFILSCVNVCSGLGGMVFPYFISFLRKKFDLNGTFLIIGAVQFNILPCALLWSDKIGQDNQRTYSKFEENSGVGFPMIEKNEDGKMKESDARYVKNLHNVQSQPSVKLCKRVIQLKSNTTYIFFSFGQALANSTTLVALIFIVDEFLDSGFSKNDGDLALLLFNIAGTFGRLFPGLLQQLPFVKPLMVPVFASAINAVSVLCFGMANIMGLKLGAVCALGVPFGMFLTCVSVTVLHIVGTDLLEDAMGVTMFVIGCMSIPSGPLGGLLRDATGSYFILWIVLTGMNILGLALLLVACYKAKKNNLPNM